MINKVKEAQKDNEEANVAIVKIAFGLDTQAWSDDSQGNVMMRGKLYVPITVRDKVLRKFHSSRLIVHLGSTKMYRDV